MHHVTDDRRVIVVGTGPSGAIAALTLVEQGIPVTLLESGRAFQPGLAVRVMAKTVYRKWPPAADHRPYIASGDPQALWHQALAPGGLSNYWTGAVPRFSPEDFFEGERLHERYRWPLAYEDLAPHYAQVERLLSVVASRDEVANLPCSEAAHWTTLPSEWRPLTESARSLGQGLTQLPLAEGPPWMIRRTGAAFNSFRRIVSRLRRNPDFQLKLGAHALRLEWRGEERRVESVVYYDRATGSEERVRGAAVVVAAGPLSSTTLLLNSTSSDFPDGLGNTDGLLGGYLHDHPHDWCTIEIDRPLPRLRHPAYVTRAPVQHSEPLLAAAFYLGPASNREKLLAFLPTRTNSIGLVTFGTMVPTEQNYVRLHPTERDEFGQPLLDIHIRYDEQTLQNIARAQTRLLSIFEGAGFGGAIKCSVPKLLPGSSSHYGGTVRMHESPRYGMLDAWNRLHAVANVVVADASSFTTGPEKNPTLTAMALSRRAADRLANDLKSGTLRSDGRLARAL